MKENKNSFLFSACPDILEYCEGSEINNKIKKENVTIGTIPKSNIKIVE
jgi:hypothetical protein